MRDSNTNRDVLAAILPGLDGVVRRGGDRYSFFCPLEHRKSNAAAEIWLDAEGMIGVCCHDCGRNRELWQSIVTPRLRNRNSRALTTYSYDHPDGITRITYRSDGLGGKRVWQSRGQSIAGTYVKLWPPAGGDNGDVVVWVEGERCAEAIAEVGFVGSSSIAGASNVDKSDYSPLAGRDVLVWPDDDPPGRKAGEVVANSLIEVGAARVRLAPTASRDDGADAADLAPEERLDRLRELLDSTPYFDPSSASPSPSLSNTSPGEVLKSPWFILGEVCADRLRHRFRFDSENRCWYAWREGDRWAELTDTSAITDVLHNERLRIAADLGDNGMHDLRNLLASASDWRRETNNVRGEWWASLRTALGRSRPTPDPYRLATPDGVVDLRSGDIQPHDPLLHDTLAITRGNYRPQDTDELRRALWKRLQHNISAADFEQLIAILGIAVARRSADYCGILWLYGASGSGKGATMRLIQDAFGGMGLGVSAELLERRSRTDIDADLADLLEVDPVVYCASEVSRVGTTRLNGLTGGDTFSARRPHGKIKRGSLSGMLIVTSVDAPRVAVEAGLRRRLVVIHFPHRLSETVRPNRAFIADELDAVVTLSIHAAMRVGAEGWTPPRGNPTAKAEFLAEADPVAGWLDALPDEWDGCSFRDCVEAYNSGVTQPVTDNMMGRRIKLSRRWRSVLDPGFRIKVLSLVKPS